MLKSLVKAIWVVVCLASPCAAYAVGMGGVNVSSALGEPLKAEIDLVAISKAEKGRLTARLASPEAFKSAGINYPADLSKLKFQIETRADGESYLQLTTAQPLNEPFLSLLIELSWPSGKLLREYTFLLDPPEFKAKQPEAAEVKPVAPVAEAPVKQEPAALQPSPPAPQEEKAPAAIPAPAPAAPEPPVAVAPLPAAKPAEPAAAAIPAPAPAAPGTLEVKRGDTLGQIALNSRPSGVSLERMLLALYRANSEAFDGNNMNRLKAGKILRVPDQGEINQVAQAEAVEEFRAHVANWNEYRQKLAAASSATTEQPVKQETSGKISTAIADKSTAAKEFPKEVVKLSKGETPGDKTVTSGSAKAMQEKIHALEEEAVAKEMALKASSERVALLEKNIKEMQRLIELKGQPPAAPAKPAQAKAGEQAVAKPEAKAEPPKAEPRKIETQKEETKPTAPAPVAASQPPAAPAVAAAASAAKPAKPAPKPVPVAPPPPSFIDELLGNPALLAGGAAALLALGGLGIMAARRRKVAAPGKKKGPGIAEAAGAAGAAGIAEAVAAPSSETGDFTHAAAPQSEEVDPLSEADLFLNFGRDAQAEEILKDALAKNPASNPIRLKLLSIYANRKDTSSFSVIARQVESSGDADAWAQAAEMGRSIDPANPMYGGGAEIPGAAPAQDLSKSQTITGLDFDLGIGAAETPAESATPAETTGKKELESTFTGLDFDLGVAESEQPAPDTMSTMVLSPAKKGTTAGSPEATEILAQEELYAAQQTPTDFDVSGSYTAPATEAEKTTLDDLVFDITGSPDAGEKAVAEADIPISSEETGLAFTLDFPVETQPEASSAATKGPADFDLSSINLNLETPGAAPATEVKDAHWHDVATKLDLARAYQEMGDNAGAREILEEVIAEGDEQQRAAAEALKQQLLA